MRSPSLTAIALISITVLAADPAAAEETTMSLEQWHDRIAAQEQAWRERDPDYEKLVSAAGEALCHHYGEVKRNEQTEPYFAFMEGPGKAMLERFASEHKLAPENEKYNYVIAAAYLHEGIVPKREQPSTPAQHFRTEAEQRGRAIVERAVRKGGGFTADEIHSLRLYRIIAEQSAVPGALRSITGQFAPDWELKLGETAPPLRLPTADAVMEHSPDYTEQIDRDYLTRRYLEADGLKEFPFYFGAYAEGSEGRPVPQEREPWPDWLPEDAFVDLQAIAPPKPTLLLFADPVDNWHSRIWSEISPIVRALGDRVDVFSIAVTIHDTHMPYADWYGRGYGFNMVHPQSLEERARSVRDRMMTFPELQPNWLLDGLMRSVQNTWGQRGGGGGTVVIVDADRRVAHAGRFRSDAETNLVQKGRSNCNGHTILGVSQIILGTYYDRVLTDLLAHDGKLSDAMIERLSAEPMADLPIYHRCLKVSGFDPSTGLLKGTTRSVDHRGQRGDPIEVTYKVTARTRIRTADGRASHGPAALAGHGADDLHVYTSQPDAEQPELIAVRVNRYNAAPLWLTGKVTTVGADGTIGVALDKPGQTPGMRYWAEAGDKATPTGDAAATLHLLTTLNRVDEPARTVALPSDAATFLFINGRTAEPGELNIGMPIAMGFANAAEATAAEPNAPLYPLAIRAYDVQ